MARIYRRDRIWWLRWYQNGQLSYRSLKTTNRRVALYHKAKKEQELATGRRADPNSLTFAQAAAAYLEATRPLKGEAWHYTNSKHLAILDRKLGPAKLAELTPQRLEACINEIASERQLRTKSRNNYLALARTLSRWCLDHGYIFEDFTKRLRLPTPTEPERTWLTKEQRDKILALAKQSPHYPLIAAAFYTGLRWKELVRLEWPDIDFQHRSINLLSRHAKTKRGRTFPLHPVLEPILKRLRRPEGQLFPPGDRDHYRAVQGAIQDWFKSIGVRGDRLGLHTCRHTFGTLLLQESVSIWKVSEWMGHADVKITQRRYAHRLPTYDPDIAKA